MREIVFLVTAEQPGRIEATAPEWGLVVEAPTLEELHHEARDALIRQVGPSHGTYRIRIRRGGHNPESASEDHQALRHSFRKPRLVPNGSADASRGIGRPIAAEFDHNGATLAVSYVRPPEVAGNVRVLAVKPAATSVTGQVGHVEDGMLMH